MPETDPLEILRNDHHRVERLFVAFKNTGPAEYDKKKGISKEISRELRSHFSSEEKTFYKELEKISSEGKSLISENKEEHKAIRNVIKDLRHLSVKDDAYEEKFQELIYLTGYHIQTEENKVFPFALTYIKEKLDKNMAKTILALRPKIKKIRKK